MLLVFCVPFYGDGIGGYTVEKGTRSEMGEESMMRHDDVFFGRLEKKAEEVGPNLLCAHLPSIPVVE